MVEKKIEAQRTLQDVLIDPNLAGLDRIRQITAAYGGIILGKNPLVQALATLERVRLDLPPTDQTGRPNHQTINWARATRGIYESLPLTLQTEIEAGTALLSIAASGEITHALTGRLVNL